MITHISNDKGKALSLEMTKLKYSAHTLAKKPSKYTHTYMYMYEKKESTIEIYFVWFKI